MGLDRDFLGRLGRTVHQTPVNPFSIFSAAAWSRPFDVRENTSDLLAESPVVHGPTPVLIAESLVSVVEFFTADALTVVGRIIVLQRFQPLGRVNCAADRGIRPGLFSWAVGRKSLEKIPDSAMMFLRKRGAT
jgi:hypothetical protein